MSGAAGIAAAKNRRSKPDPNQKPIISCSSKTGSCPLPPGSKQPKAASSGLDIDSLQITGPMPLMQVLKIHEKRLNKIDEKLKQNLAGVQAECGVQAEGGVQSEGGVQACGAQSCDEECYERLSTLEEKVHMLEEVIMNLQLTLTNVQSFAMETSLAMLKLQNQAQVPGQVQSQPMSPIHASLPIPMPSPIEASMIIQSN